MSVQSEGNVACVVTERGGRDACRYRAGERDACRYRAAGRGTCPYRAEGRDACRYRTGGTWSVSSASEAWRSLKSVV